MNGTKPEAASDNERDFTITRVFDAPRKLVFQAWTEPKHMKQWWGPHAITNSVCEMDVRPGGKYRIVMRTGDGVEYPMKGIYREVVAPERLVFTNDLSEHPDEWHKMIDPERLKGKGKPTLDGVTTVTFEEENGKTKMTVHMRFERAADRAAHVKFGMPRGWSESFERLGKLLSNIDARDRELKMTRVLDAPREVVFKAWTDPKQIVQWWGPNGFRTTIHEMDVRPGGEWRFIMHGPDGRDYPNHNVFREVAQPERIVFDHVSSPTHQLTATFTDEGGKTRLTVQLVFATAAEREKVAKEYRAGEGLEQTLRRLGEFLGGK
jgi:uncharacterized protein YndB with AHSA1/START domain